jgi:hypothetical protein
MTGWNLGLVLHPPAGATPGDRRAGAALLGAWLAELLAPPAVGLVEQLDHDGVPVALLVVDWLTDAADPSPAAHATVEQLEQRIAGHPATAGWTITATNEPGTPTAPPPGWLAGDEAGMAELVLAAAVHCTALPADLLAQAYDDQLADPDPDGRDLQLAAIRGALIVAAATLVDQLLDDTATLAGGGDVSDTTQLVNLPPQFGPHYTPGFARRFLVAFLDLTARLTAERWTPPSCVAQDLGMRLLLDHVDVIADLARLPLPPDWQDTLAELLVEDIDYEYLYDPALDGLEDEPDFGPPGMASMRVQDWFHPYPGHQPLPPYLS